MNGDKLQLLSPINFVSVYVNCVNVTMRANFVDRLFGMVRQTPAICAALVFDSNGLKDFKGPKYHFPDSPVPALTGINSYPIMVAVPYVCY